MNKTMLFFAAIALCVCAIAHAEVITFDDLNTQSTTPWVEVYDGYGGLNWGYFMVIRKDDPLILGSGFEKGVISGDWVAFNEYGNSCAFSGDNFTFDGAYLTSAWSEENQITVRGFDETGLRYVKTIVATNQGPAWFDFSFSGIDTLIFESSNQQFVMDNLTIHYDYSSVPEPTAVNMFIICCIALLGVILLRTRQKSFRRTCRLKL